MMSNLLQIATVFIAGEILAFFVFAYIRRIFGGQSSDKVAQAAILKGIIERLFIYAGLLNDFPHVITALAALKLGTRLADDTTTRISNDYFLVGNLVSILLAILYTAVAFNWMY